MTISSPPDVALDALVAEKLLISREALEQRTEAWDRAARATPHGKPIVLSPGS